MICLQKSVNNLFLIGKKKKNSLLTKDRSKASMVAIVGEEKLRAHERHGKQ